MRPMELTPRLRSVAELVPQGAKFADIGTDHAYLPVWLLQRGIITKALACDLRQGPLDRARATAERYGLTEEMDFRLCDGLAGVRPGEADTIAIAGLGGETSPPSCPPPPPLRWSPAASTASPRRTSAERTWPASASPPCPAAARAPSCWAAGSSGRETC